MPAEAIATATDAATPAPEEKGLPLAHELAFVMLMLITIGLLMVASTSFPASAASSFPFSLFVKQVGFLGLGLALFFVVVYLIPSERALVIAAWGGLLVSFALMGWAAAVGGGQGNRAWTPPLGPIPSFQPSEMAKILLVMVGASLFGRRPIKSLFQKEMLIFLLLSGVAMGLLAWQHDLGMLALFAALVMMMLLISGMSLLQWGVVAILAFAAVIVGIQQASYRVERVAAWLHPENYYPDGAGYQIMHNLIAIARGAVRGLGLGRSPDKFGALPNVTTDSVFPVLAGETGLWGTALLLFAFGWLLVLSYYIAAQSRSRLQWFLALGCGLTLALQAAIQITVAVNWLPCAGLTLPFISYGGTSIIASCLAMGGLMWVARRAKPAATPAVLD